MIPVIDIHTHVFPDAIAEKASESIVEFYDMEMERVTGSVGRLLESAREAGIVRSCICSVAVTPRSVASVNRFIATSVEAHPDRVTGFGAIHPDCEDLPGLVDAVLAAGLKGVKIHPDMQKFALDSPSAMEMFAAVESRLPVLIHMGDTRYDYSHPRQMKKVLDAFPDLVCICAHLGGWGEWDDAWPVLSACENVYVDTSSSLYALTPEKARELIRHYSGERVLFGTDFPMWDPVRELGRFHALKLTDAEEERILCLNARPLI